MLTKPRLYLLGRCLVGGWVLMGLARAAAAATVTLVDDNSTAVIETELQAGVVSWTVDGADQLEQLWYWFRIGDAGPESSIDSLVLDLAVISDTNLDGDDDTLFVRYKEPGGAFTIELSFQLNGGTPGFGFSNFDELITIKNTGSTTLSFHFFEYANFDLAGNANDDTVEMIGSNIVLQTDGSGSALTETITTPAGNHHELKIVPITLDALNDGSPTTLDDSDGPIGPADVTWAFQWSVTIGAGGSFQVSKLKAIELAVFCGNNNIDAGEECDGTDTGSCVGGCLPPGNPNECTCSPVCGDDNIDAGEECDGTDTGSCVGGCLPPGDPNECTCSPVCGDDNIDTGEECDGTDTGSCASECLPPGDPNECTCAPLCGDGVLDPGEDCDDGNTVDGDGCSADCLSERGACCNFDGDCEDDLSEDNCLSVSNRVWNRGLACADVACEAIPTVSEWALVIMTLLGCTMGSVIYRCRRMERA